MSRLSSPSAAAGTYLLILTLCGLVEPARAQWMQANGPEPPAVSALASDGSFLFLGTNEADAGDLYRSGDGGGAWTNAGLPDGGVTTIYVHSTGVYAGTYLTGLHRSTDHGVSWQLLDSGLSGSAIVSGLTSLGPDTLFVGTPGSPLYRSIDGGESWSVLPGSPSQGWTVLGTRGRTIFAGTTNGGLYRSTDGGSTWNPAASGLPAQAHVGAILAESAAVYLGVSVDTQAAALGLYQSTDDGSSWVKISVDLPLVISLRFTSLVSRGGVLYAGLAGEFGSQGLYRSSNGGVNWSLISADLPGDLAVLAILFQGSDLLAATGSGVYRSSDDGGTWSYTGQGTAAIRRVPSLLRFGDDLMVSLETTSGIGRGIWRTSDAGATWQSPGTGLPAGSTAAAMALSAGDILAGMYGPERGVYRSSDGGLTWSPSTAGISSSTIIRSMLVDGSVHLVGAVEALYRSTDGGHNWASVPGITNVSALTVQAEILYAGLYGAGARQSTDAGVSWTDLSAGLSSPNARTINSMAAHGGHVFAATNGDGVYRLEGASWVQAGLGGEFVYDLLDTGGALVAGTPSIGLSYTTDQGASWHAFNENYTGGEIDALGSDGTFLYAGSSAHVLWSRPLSDLPSSAAVSDLPIVDPPLHLRRIRPNPFRTVTWVEYDLASSAQVRLQVFDLQGREVALLDQGVRAGGRHAVLFDGSGLVRGVYYCRLSLTGRSETVSMLHVR